MAEGISYSQLRSRVFQALLKTKGLRHFVRPFIHEFEIILPDGSRLLSEGENYDDQNLMIREVFGQEVYEKEYHLGKGDVVIDVGANVGIFSIKAAKQVWPDGMVMAIEPATRTYEMLRENLALNGLSNVRPVNLAAGATTSEATLFLERHYGHSSLYRRSSHDRTEKVQVKRLDDIFESQGFKHCDFMKIDCEGAELDVLKGAWGILEGPRPRLSMESHKFGAKAIDILDLLSKADYVTVHQLDPDGSGYIWAAPRLG